MATKLLKAHNFFQQWEQANRAHEAYLRRLHEKLTARKIPYIMVHDEIMVSHDTCGTINVPAEFAAAVKEAMEEAWTS